MTPPPKKKKRSLPTQHSQDQWPRERQGGIPIYSPISYCEAKFVAWQWLIYFHFILERPRCRERENSSVQEGKRSNKGGSSTRESTLDSESLVASRHCNNFGIVDYLNTIMQVRRSARDTNQSYQQLPLPILEAESTIDLHPIDLE